MCASIHPASTPVPTLQVCSFSSPSMSPADSVRRAASERTSATSSLTSSGFWTRQTEKARTTLRLVFHRAAHQVSRPT
jgi:hypothetical protein